ncbi:glycosyltransferase family 39 protein [Pseudoxanthobacter sp. M-2]|uniref:glycosyltransferase family 39 protein n=1 Tax=Pseudoxanthobacter sp. M-2 TaxID=3078754 RepID=UPI0038FCDBF6
MTRAGRFFGSAVGAAAVVAALTLVRLAVAGYAPLTEDEAYYRLWALHPAFGYLDHPPMVAWWMAGGMAVAGDTALGVRLVSVLSVMVGSLALWRSALIVAGDAATAARAVIWFNATLLVGIGSVVATPDQPATLFWGLALWAVLEKVRSGDGRWWLAVGLFAGLGLQSKYSTLFLGAGLVLWLVVSAERRRWLADPWLWAGGLLAVLLFAPVIAWNAAHDWASFEKQFGRAAASEWTLAYLPELLGGQIGLLGPLMVPFVVAGLWLAGRRRTASGGSAEADGAGEAGRSLLVLSSIPFALYLLVHALHDRVQANWPAPLYPAFALIAAAAAARTGDLSGRTGRMLSALRAWVAPVGIATGLVAFLLLMHPSGFGLAGLDPARRYRGWDAAAAEIEAKRVEVGAAWIATGAYGPTAMLSWELKDVPVVQLDERLRYAAAPPPSADLLARPGLLVLRERAGETERLTARFRFVEPLGTVTRRADNATVARYALFRVSDPVGDPLAP